MPEHGGSTAEHAALVAAAVQREREENPPAIALTYTHDDVWGDNGPVFDSDEVFPGHEVLSVELTNEMYDLLGQPEKIFVTIKAST